MTGQARRKRCICGRSKELPLCDGAHRSAGWQCDFMGPGPLAFAFAASHSLRNLGDRLAHRFQGQSLHTPTQNFEASRLVLVTDGHDTARLQQIAAAVRSKDTTVLAVGTAAQGLRWAFPDAAFVVIEEEDATVLWKSAEAAVQTAAEPAERQSPPRVFLCHSVHDEAQLFPVIDILRDHFGVPLFVCADSIAPGSGWQAEIQTQLLECDLVLFLSSEHANKSVFCGFEAGMATAMGKVIHVINLDGTRLPDYLQQIQANDVPRLQNRKPWLTSMDALLEACLESVLITNQA